MLTHRHRKMTVALILGIGIGALGIAEASAKRSAAPVDESILETFDELEAHLSKLSGPELKKRDRARLIRKLEKSERAYRRGRACKAASLLGRYLNQTRLLMARKRKPVPVAEDLRNRGWMLRHDLLINLPEGMSCRKFRDVGAVPALEIGESDNQQLSGGVSFGRPLLGSVEAGGERWTQVKVPSLQSLVGEPGKPAIPTWHALVAVPMGAQARLERVVPDIGDAIQLNLLPFQEQAADIDPEPDPFTFVDQPFVKDEQAYQADAFHPAEPCVVERVGKARDLQVAQLSCAGGQYNPVTRTYRSFDGIEFAVAFEGGSGDFITSQSLSPFERASENATSTVINGAVVEAHVEVRDLLDLECLGEELLILTHPDFIDAANELAEWKQEKGITTTVEQVGVGTFFDTGAEIDALIEARYDDCVVRPSYVLLLGDSEFIPPARQDHDTSDACGPCDDETTGSDYGYALYPEFFFDIFPDFAVGRIPVDTDEQAELVVDKIIQYESNPPYIDRHAGAPFYTTAANAGQFQCCRMRADGTPSHDRPGTSQRSFIEVSETARDAMLDHGYEVERIYATTVDGGGYCIDDASPCTRQAAYSGSTTPNRYRDRSLLPADLRDGSGFLWDGDTLDVADAFNEGRFLILHRDHGSRYGMSHPDFQRGDLWRLENEELLPVVYSVNCESGYFDQESDGVAFPSESFMEFLLFEEDGGMVGGLGDNRNSPTWANTALTRGFYDATWPDLAPEFGEDESIRRLGDILNHGKMYLLTQIGVTQTAGSVSLEAALGELVIWHAFGDPTLEMWTSNPYRMLLGASASTVFGEDGLRVIYPHARATITAFQVTNEGTVPVGRAMVENGVAEIPYFHPPDPGAPIQLSASFENAVSVLLTPTQSPQLPDLVIEQILDPTQPQIELAAGEDIEDLLAVHVGNLGAAAAPGTIEPGGSVKEGYMIDLVLSTDADVPEGLAVLPGAGAFVEDGLLESGRISRTPDIPASSSVELSTALPINSDLGGIIPVQTPPGLYYLCARVDPANDVEETIEDNNATCVQVSVTSPLP